MIQTYSVSGMTCNGCKSSVEKSIGAIEAVKNVIVNLDREEAIIEMEDSISIDRLQQSLSEKFIISEKKAVQKEIPDVAFVEEKKSTIQQLFPLLLIVGFITTAAFLMNSNPWSISEFMLTFMGLFYIVFGFFKVLDVKGFKLSFSMYDPLAKRIPSYGFVYPFLELALGLLFLYKYQLIFALVTTLVILGITTIGVTKSLLSKQTIKCACLGSVLNLPMTKATFIENSIMILMAIYMIVTQL